MTTVRPEPFTDDPPVTDELVREHGLSPFEYQRIMEILGRAPTFTELGIFSALWSEHCAYKHSKIALRNLPTEDERVIQGPGENAGVLRLGEGWAVAFKVESHNHPSAVEPYEGAATGVGGILRDVFTMGARPVALLNSLRFGKLDNPRNRYLFAGVVRGIGDYGNCVGVPTIGGEVDFDESYTGNPLVNAMCVGVMPEQNVITAVARGVGNVLISVGAKTGRDGIHGASFASEELSTASEERRPQVQVGDPFTEKLLIEASLELIDSRKIIAIQDMGAAGLTSSSAEMASRGEVGVELDVSLVPTREPDMSPYEILLSESQERMLVVAPPENVADIKAIAGKWELDATAIGSVTGDGLFRVKWGDAVVAEIPGEELVGGCPLYDPDAEEDAAIRAKRNDSVDSAGTSPLEALEKLLLTPSIASKRWVYEQYDSTVQASSVIEPGGGGGVINIPGTRLGIAAATDCNSRHVLLDPYEGAKGAVAEAARNVACTGATPIGITNCLNFGSPEKPGVFYQFKEVCRGIADACTALGTPVTGGNVSFYNESPSGAVPPTPLIGMIGVLNDVSHAIATAFRFPGDTILLLGETAGHLGGSSLWAHVFGATAGEPPRVNLASEQNLIRTLTGLAASRLIRSANDLSDGGLVIALCESCFGPPYRTHALGATIRVPEARCEPMEFLFGEDHARALVSCAPEAAPEVTSVARGNDVAVTRIGVVGDPNGNLEIEVRGERITDSIVRLRELYEGAIPGIMRQTREVQ